MAAEFSGCVDYGLLLSRRIYYGKDVAPAPVAAPVKTVNYLPTAMMVYAVVAEPGIVDNPDVPSYQPYVHGRCVPPALVPLHMYGVGMEVDCCLDYAAVSVTGRWRVHCVMTSKRCDCCLAIPMGEQGSLLGLQIDIDVDGRSYHSQFLKSDHHHHTLLVPQNGLGVENGRFLKDYVYTLNIPQVPGGSHLSIKATWSQKLSYHKGRFCLNVPFTFPEYVNPVGKRFLKKREKIILNVNSGIGKEILHGNISHPLKELRREVGKLGFMYEAEVSTWSNSDFSFSYTIPSSDILAGVLLQSPPLNDFDQRQMFYLYLFPGNNQSRKVFRKEVVFMVDKSGSMKGAVLENTKIAILASLNRLSPQDSFNIIAFNDETFIWSSTMKLATNEAILNATQWLESYAVAGGGTNILAPLQQAMKLLCETTDSIPLIVLITDGAVEGERDICKFVEERIKIKGSPISPRICTFGIGSYCNHYFLKMLAQIGSGHFDYAYDADSIDFRLQRLFSVASSVTSANISVRSLEQLDSLEIFPSKIPDLSSEYPVFLSGRYNGKFLDLVNVTGTLADMSNYKLDLRVQNAMDVPLYKVFARRQIDTLTCLAWLSESEEIKDKVTKMSIQTGTPSEYARLTLCLTNEGNKAGQDFSVQKVFNKINPLSGEPVYQKIITLGSLGIGFGDLTATMKNIPPGLEKTKSSNTMLVKAASSLYSSSSLLRVCGLLF
ncbi:hypothetical protein ACFE04_004001 [Oxalis oulophora]